VKKSVRPALSYAGPPYKFNWALSRDDRDNFECHRIDNQSAITDQDVIEAAIFGTMLTRGLLPR
jgi:hypothetical protein